MNDKGIKTAVVIDMKLHRERIEDFIDGITAEAYRNEPAIPLKQAIEQRRNK